MLGYERSWVVVDGAAKREERDADGAADHAGETALPLLVARQAQPHPDGDDDAQEDGVLCDGGLTATPGQGGSAKTGSGDWRCSA